MKGVELRDIPNHSDRRGSLIAFDQHQSLPFILKRYFFIWGCPPDAERGGHALSANCALLALRGKVAVDLDNGAESLQLELDGPYRLLCINAGVWLRLHRFSTDALVAVAASECYADTRYFPSAQPALIEQPTP